jgi:hypothetical protein
MLGAGYRIKSNCTENTKKDTELLKGISLCSAVSSLRALWFWIFKTRIMKHLSLIKEPSTPPENLLAAGSWQLAADSTDRLVKFESLLNFASQSSF